MDASPLPAYDTALATLLARVERIGVQSVHLEEARGRVLRQAVLADRDQPPFHRAAMDGFAVRVGQIARGKAYRVAGDLPAGAPSQPAPPDHAVMRIATGAPVPPWADAVVPVEQAQIFVDEEADHVRFDLDAAAPGMNVHRQGSDIQRGSIVLHPGTLMGPQHLGIAAAVGAMRLVVSKRPRVTVLTTGDEVVPPDTVAEDLQPQQIRNSNGPMLVAMLTAMGAPPLSHTHVPDESEETLTAAREALSHSHLVITAGGVSVGPRDFLPWAWQTLGLTTLLHGVAIQPGKPVFAAGEEAGAEGISDCGLRISDLPNRGSLPPNPKSEIRNPKLPCSRLVLGLPGNPVSVLVTAHLFAWAVVRAMMEIESGLPWRDVPLAEPARASSKRQIFRAAVLQRDGSARVITGQGSGDLMHTAGADGLIRLPRADGQVAAGTRLPFLELL
ncbi:MAG: molybdopterin molybdotransferase MoeA [Phycisphaeraceae bacterium]